MASAKELRDTVTKNREALIAAIEASAAKWDTSPGGDAWSPRQNAEHAIGADIRYGGQASAILGGNPPAAVEASFASAAEAAEALKKAGAEVDKRFSWAEDRDLSKAAGGKTLEAVLAEAASHLAEHTQNIQSAS
ncbi:MAG: DinB family protein [Dehalococcoidia bacterium]|nr:DinB family protein [Dehalococcoidia bacterium]